VEDGLKQIAEKEAKKAKKAPKQQVVIDVDDSDDSDGDSKLDGFAFSDMDGVSDP
jgi:hypothetical protein